MTELLAWGYKWSDKADYACKEPITTLFKSFGIKAIEILSPIGLSKIEKINERGGFMVTAEELITRLKETNCEETWQKARFRYEIGTVDKVNLFINVYSEKEKIDLKIPFEIGLGGIDFVKLEEDNKENKLFQIKKTSIIDKLKEYEIEKKAEIEFASLIKKEGSGIVPEKIDDFIVNKEVANKVLSSIERGKNVLIVGEAGCGKSTLVQKLCQHLGKKVYRCNLNGGTTDSSFIGERGLATDEHGNTITKYEYGILPKAMIEGAILLLDEFDFAQPEYLAVMQGVFEGNGTPLVLMDNGGEIVKPHKDFRIVATANTLGRGGTNGYHGTNVMNIATLDRWSIIKMTYSKFEKDILLNMGLHNMFVDKLLELADKIRKAIKVDELPNMVFSTRRLIAIGQAFNDSLLSFEDALDLELLGRLNEEEHSVVRRFVTDIFGV